MRRLEVKDRKVMSIAIQNEISRSEEARYDHRLHGVLMVANGYDCYEAAKCFGENPVTIQRWVKRFNEHGFDGLQEGEHPGRPSRIGKQSWAKLETDLRKHPSIFGYSQNLWDGKLLSRHLVDRYGIDIKVRQCQKIFRKMGFRRRKPRPLIAKADPKAQAALKKTAPIVPERSSGYLEPR